VASIPFTGAFERRVRALAGEFRPPALLRLARE
jgi:hypothetical protein